VKDYDIYDTIIENERERANKLPGNERVMWKRVEYSQNQIKKAGKTIVRDNLTSVEEEAALEIINNWRASHAFPLNTITMHLKRIADADMVVVQRLKRLDSIVGKLKRFPNMSLCAMQDLGGCRVIVNSVEDVYKVAERLKASRIRHILREEYDYIQKPKQSGYRSFHLVYKYHSDRAEDYNQNMLIEIQIRTMIQHVWATAVETMGIYTKSALKASFGDEEVLRFFALVSSVFSMYESGFNVPGTSDELLELVDEIKKIDKEKNIVTALSAIRVAIEHVKELKGQAYYILILNYEKKTLKIHYYKKSQIDVATKSYDAIEKNKGKNIDAVLVSATSLDSLRAAYPNYFSDIGGFIETLRKILE